LQQYNQSRLSMRRIMEYLDMDDLVEYVVHAEPQSSSAGAVAVELKGLSMGWQTEAEAAASAAATAAASAAASAAAASKTSDGKTYAAAPQEPPAATTTTTATATADADADAAPASVAVAVLDHSNRAVHTLRDLSVQVLQGQLVAVVGSVGSGKSSLLSTLLGEMVVLGGEVVIRKHVDASGNPYTPRSECVGCCRNRQSK
jgi:ABC-type transport system involved in cytochrome bd biosynthesis fused ATPase/permease subunit